jgi:PTH1 family peptidyl-tRNA hydrolase
LPIKVIAGLGNDDKKYRHTLHNIGFLAVDALAERLDLSWLERDDFRAARSSLPHAGAGFALVKARTYMNVCGSALAKAVKKANAQPEEFLVVVDDFALPWGRLRLRRSGSAGGHNGLKSLIDSLGTDQFPRLRVGVGPVPPGADPADFVLNHESPARLEDLASKAAEALEAVLEAGLEKAMNRINAPELAE